MMKEILVYADWLGLDKVSRIGFLRVDKVRGEEIFSFEYDDNWIKSGNAKYIDPDLKLFVGPQYLSDQKPNFGVFLDSSPDRWGRMLLQRKESVLARVENRPVRRLAESDFLLGLNDLTRMGGIRFKLDEGASCLAEKTNCMIPPVTSIRELEQISLKLESDVVFQDEHEQRWIDMLVAPGSSLGGARPKANVIDSEGDLLIAKFPSRNDSIDKGAWEYLAYLMAKESGINISASMANKYSQKHHTFLTKRFDREKNDRIHFASAMCLLGYKDGYSYKDGGSYLEIIEFIEQYGASPTEDIKELWKRVVFSVAISNTDDHLRNHGFLLTKRGWKLSPAFDVNPEARGTGLSLNINETDNSLDFDLCMSVVDYFRMKEDEAYKIIKQIKEVVSSWRSRADDLKISRIEQQYMEHAFSGK